jgi:hypothetical protein
MRKNSRHVIRRSNRNDARNSTCSCSQRAKIPDNAQTNDRAGNKGISSKEDLSNVFKMG